MPDSVRASSPPLVHYPFQSIKRAFRWMRARLASRPDSEHEMMPNRLAFAGLVMGYLLVASALGHAFSQQMLADTWLWFVIYFFVSLGLFAHILWRPGISPSRRVFAMVHDFSMISIAAAAGGMSSGFFYPLYLWTVIGNGFRFGVWYLYVAMALALLALTIVLMVTGIWTSYIGLSIALLAGMVLLPAYAGVLIRKLSEAKRQAEDANRAKSLFLASVSHELRTPLNAIIGLSDLLREQPLRTEQREMVDTISLSGQSLLSLINGILDFTRIEAQQMPSNVSQFDLPQMVRKVRDMLAVQAQTKSLHLTTHFSADTPRLIEADMRHLEEVLANLASNAVKFTLEGEVIIAVDLVSDSEGSARLRFEVSDTGIGIEPDAQARIFDSFTQANETIIDRFGGTGLGLAISKQLVEMMGGTIGIESTPGEGSLFWFEIEVASVSEQNEQNEQNGNGVFTIALFSQDEMLKAQLAQTGAEICVVGNVREAREPISAAQGSALVVIDGDETDDGGRRLAQSLADELDRLPPAILVADDPDDPASAYFRKRSFVTTVSRHDDQERIAAAVDIARTAITFPGSDAGSGGGMVARRRMFSILVAEDNPTNRMVIAKILETAGHAVTLVNNGEEALESLNNHDFDLVLMDVNMPVMNGIEAAKLYRFTALGQDPVPIVALTADATPETRDRCAEAGMSASVTKPIEASVLLSVIEETVPQNGQSKGNLVVDSPESGLRDDHSDISHDSGDAVPVIDVVAIENLRALGGTDFLRQLLDQFATDSNTLLQALHDSLAEEDVFSFRSNAHALASAAANVGATALCKLCTSRQGISPMELARDGEDHLAETRSMLDETRAALEAHAAEERVGESRVGAPAAAE